MGTRETKAFFSEAFETWHNGGGSVLGLLADDVRWTLNGSSPIAGEYVGRPAFLAASRPVSQRLREPFVIPTVRSIVAEDDEVAVAWKGSAVALDGLPYNNTYCWLMRLKDNRVVEGSSFYDDVLVSDLIRRVEPVGPGRKV